MGRRREPIPLFWGLFSAGGMAAALALPALAGFFWFAIPLGWVEPSALGEAMARLEHPLARIALFGFLTLCFFHWAHRFRYTLYDGLQLGHLYGLIATLTYGVAAGLSVVAGVVLWSFP